MEAGDFIAFAGKVATFGAAGARSAISRAYYGSFHLAISLLEDLGCAPARNASAHRLVYEFFACSSLDSAKAVASSLQDLHSARLRADYHLDDETVESFQRARVEVETADDVRTHVNAFRNACQDPNVVEELRRGIDNLKNARQI